MLIVQWVSAIANILVLLLLILQIELELDLVSGSGSIMLWSGLSTVVQALAALATVVLTIVVLAQVRRHERVVAPTVQTPRALPARSTRIHAAPGRGEQAPTADIDIGRGEGERDQLAQ